jgi:hypothetical protein
MTNFHRNLLLLICFAPGQPCHSCRRALTLPLGAFLFARRGAWPTRPATCAIFCTSSAIRLASVKWRLLVGHPLNAAGMPVRGVALRGLDHLGLRAQNGAGAWYKGHGGRSPSPSVCPGRQAGQRGRFREAPFYVQESRGWHFQYDIAPAGDTLVILYLLAA